MSNLNTQKPVPHDVAIFLHNLSALLDKTLKDSKLPEEFLEYDGIGFPDNAVHPIFPPSRPLLLTLSSTRDSSRKGFRFPPVNPLCLTRSIKRRIWTRRPN